MREGTSCSRSENCVKDHCRKHDRNFVQDAETLLRMELWPEHYDREEGCLKDAAFSQSQFVSRGYSIDRKKLCDEAEYARLVRAMNSMKEKRRQHVEAIGSTTAKGIRGIRIEHADVFFLCPSSSLRRPSHADIFTRHGKKFSPSRWNDIRDQLRRIFTLIPPESVFSDSTTR